MMTLPQPTGELLDDPNWTSFTREMKVEYRNGPEALLRRGADGQDYLALRTGKNNGVDQWAYVPLEEDGRGWPRPELTESLTGTRPLRSVLGNADQVYIVDQDPETKRFIRTVRIALYDMPEDDPFREKLPGDEAQLKVSPEAVRRWKEGGKRRAEENNRSGPGRNGRP